MLHYSWVVPLQTCNNRGFRPFWIVSRFHSSFNSLPPATSCVTLVTGSPPACSPAWAPGLSLWEETLPGLGSFHQLSEGYKIGTTEANSSTRQLPLTLTSGYSSRTDCVTWEGTSLVLITPVPSCEALNALLDEYWPKDKSCWIWYIGTNNGCECGHMWVKSPMEHI